MGADNEKFSRQWDRAIDKVYGEFGRHTEHFNYDDDILNAQQHAKEYAQMAIRHIFLINGGALIALPAIIAAFELPKTVDIWCSGLSYSTGLVLIVFTSLFAYYSLVSGIVGLRSGKFKNYVFFYIQNMRPFLSEKNIKNEEKQKGDYKDTEDKKLRHSFIWEVLAVASGVLSLVCFIYGTYLITNVVWDYQEKNRVHFEIKK